MAGNFIRVTFIAIFFQALYGCDAYQEEEFQGYIDGDLTFLASSFSGVLETLEVQEGDKVSKNQSLAQLELEPQQSQLKQATFELESSKKTLDNLSKGERETVVAGIEAEIAKAESELALAEARLNRARALFDKGLSDKDALDQANTQYSTKLDTLNQLKAKLEEAKQGSRVDVILAQKARVGASQARVDELAWALASKKLKAPDEGYIFDTFYRQGEFVPASKPIMSMIMPQEQYIIFFLPMAKAHTLKINDKVTIDCEGCTQRYQAKISYIAPKVEFTPPVIFSRQHHDKYVYRLHAKLNKEDSLVFHLGQPVYVKLSG